MTEETRVRTASLNRSDEAYAVPPRGSNLPWIILAVVVALGIVAAVLFRDRLFAVSGSAKTASAPYQAVFLTNGQVYFGKMSEMNSESVVLTDIFYLQVQNPPIQGSQEQEQKTQAQAQPQLFLIKLGNELHGPVDKMHINSDQILFYEDMKEDSKVVQEIKKYKANPDAGKPASPQTQAQPQTVPSVDTSEEVPQAQPTGKADKNKIPEGR